jgi:hypothetical protein
VLGKARGCVKFSSQENGLIFLGYKLVPKDVLVFKGGHSMNVLVDDGILLWWILLYKFIVGIDIYAPVYVCWWCHGQDKEHRATLKIFTRKTDRVAWIRLVTSASVALGWFMFSPPFVTTQANGSNPESAWERGFERQWEQHSWEGGIQFFPGRTQLWCCSKANGVIARFF